MVMDIYYKEMQEMLNKYDTTELLKFIAKWHKLGVLEKKVYLDFLNADEKVKKGTLCKMICNSQNIDRKVLKQAKKWLKDNEWDESFN